MRLLFLLLLVALVANTFADKGIMVCYFSSWAVYRPGQGAHDVEDVDPFLCTHVTFGFAGLNHNNNKIKVLDPYNELCKDYGLCAYNRFCDLKKINPELKTLLAVGGWNEGSKAYSAMAADPAKRKVFVSSTLELLNEHGFDGVDMDWEYPTKRGGKPEDRENFAALLKELSDALHAEGKLLTVAVSAGKDKIDDGYDVPAMSEAVDIISVMTYDLHGDWEPVTGHQSALYPHPDDTGDAAYLNGDFAIHYWLKQGAPKNKLVMGIPLYGRCWSLDHPDQNGYYAPASQPGPGGKWTEEPGMWGYNEICVDQKTHDWTIVNDPAMHEPYAFYIPTSRIWCSYDHTASAAIKAAYARDLGIAGCMVWSLDTDDYRNLCGEGPYPLTTTIVEVFNGEPYTRPPTPEPPTRDPDATTTPRPPTPTPGEHCDHLGINPDPNDCTHYYDCTQSADGAWIENEESCAGDTLFNPEAKICDWPDHVCSLPGNVCPNDCPQ